MRFQLNVELEKNKLLSYMYLLNLLLFYLYLF